MIARPAHEHLFRGKHATSRATLLSQPRQVQAFAFERSPPFDRPKQGAKRGTLPSTAADPTCPSQSPLSLSSPLAADPRLNLSDPFHRHSSKRSPRALVGRKESATARDSLLKMPCLARIQLGRHRRHHVVGRRGDRPVVSVVASGKRRVRPVGAQTRKRATIKWAR